MALFFDSEWFDARLAASHLTRAAVAQALGISEHNVAEIWKDQRELSACDVSTLAALLAASPQDIAHHAGISTPVPKTQPSLADIVLRLERVETELAHIKSHMAARP